MLFTDLSLSESTLATLAKLNYTTPTPIQALAIPAALQGRDVWGCAQTGTGKTAAFAIPAIERLAKENVQGHRRPRCLVLCPTRELATQIADYFRPFSRGHNIRFTIICGGLSQNPQVDAIRRGVDILVATPGRLKDLVEQGHIDLRSISMLVLDEADRMLDMGFFPDIKHIVSLLPEKKQTMLFSATMPGPIRKLADSLMTNPVVAEVARESTTAERIEEGVYLVAKRDKAALLTHLLQNQPMYRTIVFTRTKHGADFVVKKLERQNIPAVAIHGNKSQPARLRALADFANDRVGVLVATDIASRGIDVDGITHVVNYDVTNEPETYVHRIGRTARAGASGIAISFCDREERGYLRDIERLVRRQLPVLENPLPPSEPTPEEQQAQRERGFKKSKANIGFDPDRPRSAPPLPGRGSKGQFNPRHKNNSKSARPYTAGAPEGFAQPRENVAVVAGDSREGRSENRQPQQHAPRADKPREYQSQTQHSDRPRKGGFKGDNRSGQGGGFRGEKRGGQGGGGYRGGKPGGKPRAHQNAGYRD